MKMSDARVIGYGAVIGLLSAVAVGGDLNPPAGPVGSTMKDLVEVEPRRAINATNTPGDSNSVYRIAVSGSYYLTGHVTGVAGSSGIEIQADDVTIDLNGFTVRGVPGSLDGITMRDTPTTFGDRHRLTVRNGIVRDWEGGHGIELNGNYQRVENVVAINNGTGGILVRLYSRVSNCTASGNTLTGISAADYCVIENCIADGNTGSGIVSGLGSFDDEGGTIVNCSATNNGFLGIAVGAGATVSGCSASRNTNDGIVTTSGSVIDGCNADHNGGDGIVADSGCTIVNCAADNNTGDGIAVVMDCSVLDCTANANGEHGIEVDERCVIRGNTCTRNVNGGGIYVIPPDLLDAGQNRIEGNSCISNRAGIWVNTVANIIMKNTCNGNTTANWEITQGNRVAPIVVAGSNAAGISGDSYAGSLGSTDPNANFTY